MALSEGRPELVTVIGLGGLCIFPFPFQIHEINLWKLLKNVIRYVKLSSVRASLGEALRPISQGLWVHVGVNMALGCWRP